MTTMLFGRRGLLLGAAAASATLAMPRLGAAQAAAPSERQARSYLLVHGAFNGGWVWRPVADRLRAAGHRVFTPTMTGMSDRRHLLSPSVTLDTWIEDIVNLAEAEELSDFTLVGYSFGGIPALGALDRMADRVRRLVLLDALVASDGQSALDILPPENAEGIRRANMQVNGVAVLPPPQRVSIEGPEAQWLLRRFTPHPRATWEAPLRLTRPPGAGRPRTYVRSPIRRFRASSPADAGSGHRVSGSGWKSRPAMPG